MARRRNRLAEASAALSRTGMQLAGLAQGQDDRATRASQRAEDVAHRDRVQDFKEQQPANLGKFSESDRRQFEAASKQAAAIRGGFSATNAEDKANPELAELDKVMAEILERNRAAANPINVQQEQVDSARRAADVGKLDTVNKAADAINQKALGLPPDKMQNTINGTSSLVAQAESQFLGADAARSVTQINNEVSRNLFPQQKTDVTNQVINNPERADINRRRSQVGGAVAGANGQTVQRNPLLDPTEVNRRRNLPTLPDNPLGEDGSKGLGQEVRDVANVKGFAEARDVGRDFEREGLSVTGPDSLRNDRATMSRRSRGDDQLPFANPIQQAGEPPRNDAFGNTFDDTRFSEVDGELTVRKNMNGQELDVPVSVVLQLAQESGALTDDEADEINAYVEAKDFEALKKVIRILEQGE